MTRASNMTKEEALLVRLRLMAHRAFGAMVENRRGKGEEAQKDLDALDWAIATIQSKIARPQPDPITGLVPVVRGEWIVDECDTSDDVPSYSWIDFHCSECNTNYGLEEGQYSWYRYEKIPYNYCPNCGAKMEGRQ